jgi:Peptidase family M28
MLNGRLYRVAFVPFMLALAVAAFSLGARPAPLTSTFAPDAFEGQLAFAQLQTLAARYPHRRPGGAGDDALAGYVAHTLEGLGGATGGGFSVRTERLEGQTIDGERTLTTVIAQRPGSTDATPILILAHRDALADGSAAGLSGTAALLELARVFAARETKRTIILASTSGGSGGAAGAAELPPSLRGQVDAAIVLGDVAGISAREPSVVPYSDGFGSAPLQLQRTLQAALTSEGNFNPGAPSLLGQLAHLAFPLAVGEQGVLDAEGLPAVLVQVSGERGPSPAQKVSAARMETIGRATLSAVDALDTAPDVSHAMDSGLLLHGKTVPVWTLRLLVAMLLLPVLVAGADGLARARRRRQQVGRWALWALSCALPFFACALFAFLLGWLGILAAAPSVPVLPSALPFDGEAITAVAAALLTFALAWLLWGVLVRRLGLGVRPDPETGGLATLLVALAVGVVVWAGNPYTALLLLPALHLGLLLAWPELRPRRAGSLALVALALVPLALLVAFYAHQLGLGVGGVAWTGLLLIAGGHIGLVGAMVWSVAFGCVAAAGLVAAGASSDLPLPGLHVGVGTGTEEVTIRGPLSYAGPGSLGGTESALRR